MNFNKVKATINIVKDLMEKNVNKIKGKTMDEKNLPQWILALDQEDLNFIKNFIITSGSLKEISKLYEVSYPTVRLRLDKLIQKINLNDKQEQQPFCTFIKGLAIDSKIDLETAKMIIEKYKEEKEEK
ncbi:Protein of unknown function (DUF2089) [Romboutsia lituseburensis]|uniref:DUF2089 domain-containing protein n=2 Tax=Romboutsia lituseburensis TaxID=1537 RepID=A0A1G9PFW1_9FIRM|nr:Protein of unknown function (DUF2089) [Romboutsia lituseburensis]SDL97660.1 Protein of unknown function [Romboutsia lituseburensis DSM 797]